MSGRTAKAENDQSDLEPLEVAKFMSSVRAA